MTAAITGSYADFKIVKTRSVAQLVIEIPIEKAQQAIEMFGLPTGGEEIPVALARLVAPAEPKPEKDRKSFASLPASQQAAMKCQDENFRSWLAGITPGCMSMDAEGAAEIVRYRCNVHSRRELDTDQAAAHLWQTLLKRYVDHREGIR